MISKSHLISLSAVPGMGPRRIRALLRKYPELDDITTLSKADMMQVKGISGELAANVKRINLDIGKRAVTTTESMGARYFTYWDSEYPELLKIIYDAPVGIFVLGKIPQLPCIGIVGTRHPSAYGKKSGAVITALNALDQNREVFSLPGQTDSSNIYWDKPAYSAGGTIGYKCR